jgi:hypothetical protein
LSSQQKVEPMTDTEPRSGAELLARIKPQRRERKCGITLRPDLLEAWEDAEDDLQKAEDEWKRKREAGVGRAADRRPPELVELAERVESLQQQIEDTRLIVTFKAMNKPEWQALIEKFPPRADNLPDQISGYDREAVKTALVRECLKDPVFEDCDCVTGKCDHGLGPHCDHTDCGSWQALEVVINPVEWETLAQTAYEANSGVIEAPKSVLADTVLSSRAPDSKSPKNGVSRPGGSTGGNPKKSTSSKTQTGSPAN